MSNDPLNRCLKKFFSPAILATPSQFGEIGYALQELVVLFVKDRLPNAEQIVRFDPIAIKAIIARFQRDSFGVYNYEEFLKKRLTEGAFTEKVYYELSDKVKHLGIRINSSNPRKTRIAAAFSLWFSALKPIRLTGDAIEGISERQLMTLDGMCNFWIATQFLCKFGEINLGEGADKQERINRIVYDLSVRDLNLSSLEMLYCSILRVGNSEVIPR